MKPSCLKAWHHCERQLGGGTRAWALLYFSKASYRYSDARMTNIQCSFYCLQEDGRFADSLFYTPARLTRERTTGVTRLRTDAVRKDNRAVIFFGFRLKAKTYGLVRENRSRIPAGLSPTWQDAPRSLSVSRVFTMKLLKVSPQHWRHGLVFGDAAGLYRDTEMKLHDRGLYHFTDPPTPLQSSPPAV